MIHEHFIPALFAEAEPADLIAESAGKTYIGRYCRSEFNPDKSAEEQPIWTIRLIDSSDSGVIKTLYPNGLQKACFIWNQRETYNYKYAL